MGSRIRQHAAFLRLLQDSKENQRKALIESMTNSQLDALCQLISNIMQGNIPVTDGYIKKLKRHKNVIYPLVTRKVSRAKKRELLSQLLRLIPFILKPALPWLKN